MRKLICALAAALTIAPPLARAQEVQPAQPAQEYVLGPDSQRQPGVPQGKVAKHEWTSKIYPPVRCVIIGSTFPRNTSRISLPARWFFRTAAHS